MTQWKLSVIGLGVLAVLGMGSAGCDNPNYCPGINENDNCDEGGTTSCSSSADCGGALPVCDREGSQACVQCTAAEAGACDGATPVCGADLRCRSCETDGECASDVCLPDGSCADAAQVAFVEEGGTGTTECTRQEPCATLQQGVDAGLAYVRVTGAVVNPGLTTIARAVTILGRSQAAIDRSGDGTILEIRDGANAQLRDVTVTGSSGSAPAIVLPTGGAPELALIRSRVVMNSGVGIQASAGRLVLHQSVVLGNTLGGVSLANTDFDFVNAIIAKNGGPLSLFGGLYISLVPNNGAARALAFTTIVQNSAPAGVNAGVVCSAVGAPLTFTSTIVYGNGSAAQVEGSNCNWMYSDIGPLATQPSGTGNIDAAPTFANAPQNDFHLVSGSAGQDAADPDATLTFDLDGAERPKGGRSDMGAYEIQ